MPTKKDDAVDEVQAKVDKEQEQGFRGVKTDPVPDEDYSLLTGPDAPPNHPDAHSRNDQHPLKEG